MVWRNHSGEDIVELTIKCQEAVWIHLLIFRKEFEIIEQSILELDRLTDVFVVHNSLDTVTEVRCAEVERVFYGLALELDWQFHLARTAGCNLKKNYAKSEGVS